MHFFIMFMFMSYMTTNCKSASITYDERQTGDYNIRISVKDLRIVALLGDGLGALGDYDYNYDYSDLTVKPSTSSPSTTTKKESDEETTTVKVVEITPAVLKPNASTTVNVDKPTQPALINLHPDPVNPLNLNASALSAKPNTTSPIFFFTPSSTSNFIGDSILSALQSPTVQTPIQNVLANFSSIFTELVESGSLGFRNNSNSSSEGNPENANIPVKVLVTPVEVHYHNDVTASTAKPENTTVKRVRHGDCMEGYRKDKRGICRPILRRPTQPSLLKKLLQLSRRMQNKNQPNQQNQQRIEKEERDR